MYPTPKILMTNTFFTKDANNGLKNEVSLTNNFYGLPGVKYPYMYLNMTNNENVFNCLRAIQQNRNRKLKIKNASSVSPLKKNKMGQTAVSDIESPIDISDPINLVKRDRGKYCKFAYFNKTVDTKTGVNRA